MNKLIMTALLGTCLAAQPMIAGAQTTPPPTGPNATPAGQMPGPVPEEQPVPKNQPASKEAQQKQGNETGWGGQQKTDEEQKSEDSRNEAQGQPPG